MYKKLKPQFALRGWHGLPYGIMDTKTGRTGFIDAVAFQAASFCDGKMNLESPLVLPAHREAITKLESAGVIEDCLPDAELESWQKYRCSAGRWPLCRIGALVDHRTLQSALPPLLYVGAPSEIRRADDGSVPADYPVRKRRSSRLSGFSVPTVLASASKPRYILTTCPA